MSGVIAWSDVLYPGEACNFFAASPVPAFASHDADFNFANAWWLAELSRLVYRQDIEEVVRPLEPRRAYFLANVGLQQCAFFHDSSNGTQAFLVKAISPQPFAALVFRGTDQNIRDLLCDLEIGSSLGSGVRVHAGFERAFASIWPQIEQELTAIDLPLFYAGHSLGAALATIAATRRKPVAVYAYGSPRVGNAAFAAQLAGVPVYRVVHGDDLVTFVPPEALGFCHVGKEVRLGAAASPARTFDVRALWEQWRLPPKALADHAPLNYVTHILRANGSARSLGSL